MRSLYFVIGLLAGIIFTADVGIQTVNQVNAQWERSITPFALMGYHEGWQRGRDWTMTRYQWILTNCEEELNQARKGN